MKNRLIVDIDDTILDNKNRDYEHAEPHQEVIDKLNALYDSGMYSIVFFTSRGMRSCNGNAELAKRKNDSILRKWLTEHNVKYDDIIYGKPLGDLYIDDKAMHVNDFLSTEFEQFTSGHSGYPVTRTGNVVKKCMSEDNLLRLQNWYRDSAGIAKSPKFISNLYTSVYMEYIDGKLASYCMSDYLLNKIIVQIDLFSRYNDNYTFNLNKQLDVLNKNRKYNDTLDNMIDYCTNKLKSIDFTSYASLCHGDMILSNIIVQDSDLYLIDSQYDIEASSYLLDFAKLRMSMSGYEEQFNGVRNTFSKYVTMLDKYLMNKYIFNEVLILQLMYTLRLCRYNEDKLDDIIHMCNRIISEIEVNNANNK